MADSSNWTSIATAARVAEASRLMLVEHSLGDLKSGELDLFFTAIIIEEQSTDPVFSRSQLRKQPMTRRKDRQTLTRLLNSLLERGLFQRPRSSKMNSYRLSQRVLDLKQFVGRGARERPGPAAGVWQSLLTMAYLYQASETMDYTQILGPLTNTEKDVLYAFVLVIDTEDKTSATTGEVKNTALLANTGNATLTRALKSLVDKELIQLVPGQRAKHYQLGRRVVEVMQRRSSRSGLFRQEQS
ncbi:MAG: hypothetical protein AAGD43_04110 [Pseudomonadota bacterium]